MSLLMEHSSRVVKPLGRSFSPHMALILRAYTTTGTTKYRSRETTSTRLERERERIRGELERKSLKKDNFVNLIEY